MPRACSRSISASSAAIPTASGWRARFMRSTTIRVAAVTRSSIRSKWRSRLADDPKKSSPSREMAAFSPSQRESVKSSPSSPTSSATCDVMSPSLRSAFFRLG